jgi:hypothetical protein
LEWILRPGTSNTITCQNPETSCSISAAACCRWEIKVVYPGVPENRRVSGEYTWTRVVRQAQGDRVITSRIPVDFQVTGASVGLSHGDATSAVGGTTATMQIRFVETGPDIAEPTLLNADISVAVH